MSMQSFHTPQSQLLQSSRPSRLFEELAADEKNLVTDYFPESNYGDGCKYAICSQFDPLARASRRVVVKIWHEETTAGIEVKYYEFGGLG